MEITLAAGNRILRLQGIALSRGYLAVFALKNKNTNNRWMHIDGVPSNQIGHPIVRRTSVRSVTFDAKNAVTGTIHIRKNNSPTNLYTMTLTAEEHKKASSLSETLLEEDELQVFLEASTGADFPKVSIELVQ